MATYDRNDPTVNMYLANGGTQADVDAYFASNPDAAKVAGDSQAYMAGVGGPGEQRVAQHKADEAQFGAGSGSIYDPWNQPTYRQNADGSYTTTKGYSMGTGGALVKNAGGPMPAGGPTMAPAGSAAALGYASLGAGGGGYGGVGTGAGTMANAYTSPDGGGGLQGLQNASVAGLQGLIGRDTSAQRKAIEDALYAGQEEGINSAADRSRQAMLEGTFGRGVGSSSILVELAGRGEQERSDALARARREAFTQAGSEDRADLASQLGLYNSGASTALSGIQGNANIRLADLAREQSASQFGQNLAFQGSQNDANRALSSQQFQGNLGLQQQQLAQQGSQFGQNLAFQGTQADLNRAQQTAMSDAQMQQALALLAQQQTFAGTQNQAQRDAAAALQASSQQFQGGQNDAQRAAAAAAQASGQDFTGTQAGLTRDQQNQNLLLQLANQQDIAGGNRLAAGLGAAGAGAGALLGPWLAQYVNGLGRS